ncbi:MAG: DHHW family protein [Ruminococcus callidus]|nr:DHHW family protein [Ruminococcus callidus]
MRKKNPNSSVPNGMHSLAQRSQQERRQKIENQQRARAATAQQNGDTMQHVPESNAAYYGKKPMKQVPPPSVQKPEKPISQEALEQLRQQARRQPTDGAPLKPMEFYDHFFAEVPTQPESKSVQPISSSEQSVQSSNPVITPDMLRQIVELAQQADATPKTVSLQTEKSSEVRSNAHSARDARSMPEMPTTVPKKPSQALQPETVEQLSRPVITPDMLRQMAELAQQADATPQTISFQTEEPAAAKPSISAPKARAIREPRKMPEMPTAVPKKQPPVDQPSEPESIEDSPFITTAMLRQMAAAGETPVSLQKEPPAAKTEKQTVRFYGKPDPETVQPTEQRQPSRPAKPRDIALETAVPVEPTERFAEELPQVAEKRTKYLKNRHPKASVAELTGTAEKKSHANAGSTSKARKFFQELFIEDAPIDTESSKQQETAVQAASVDTTSRTAENMTSNSQKAVLHATDEVSEQPRKRPVVSHASEEAPEQPKKRPVVSHAMDEVPEQLKKRPVVSHAMDEVPEQPKKRPVVSQAMDEMPEQPKKRPVLSHAWDDVPQQPKKRPVVSHAMDEIPEQPEKRPIVSHAREEEPEQPQLESAAFYERLFHDFPEQPEAAAPTAEEVAQQQRKEAVIASVKGAVSAAEQNPSSKKQISKRAYLQQKAERLGMTIGVSVIGGMVLVLAIVLLIAPRSTISYEENRVLAERPEFSLTALLNGSYTAGLAEYYNDTVPFRSQFKKTISSMMQWTGIQDEEDTVFFGNVQQVKKKETTPAVTTTEAVTTAAEEMDGTTEATVTTTVVTTTEDPNEEPAAEIGDGIILDHKRAICVYGGSFSTGQDYAESLNAYQEALGDDVQVYSMVATTAVSYYLPEEYADYTASETENIDHINRYLKGVKPVDVYAALEPHTAEAIYARTDHHWLPLGAYYAAEAFAEVAEVPFAPLSDYDTATKDDYVGSMYTYTESAVLLDNPEEFTYYIPKNQYTTTYYSTSFTDPQEGDLLVNIDDYAQSMYYLVFMGGDDKITHVETDCKNGRTLVIFKDSYGNALVPCLTQSFENIYVCDIRYFDLNAIDFCQEVGCTDLLFAMNTYSATGSNESYLESNRLQ